MKVYCCTDRFEDMMTCIYDAWCAGIKEGHENILLRKEPILQQDLFHEYIHVDYCEEKTTKVIRSIQKKISWSAYISVFYACLSVEEDALQAVYEFLRIGFKVGGKVVDMKNEPAVLRLMEIRRKVANEATLFREFVRFTSVGGGVYSAHIETKNNILLIIANHFADRMPSEHWMIVDDTRKYAIIHPKNEDYFTRELTDSEYADLRMAYEQVDEYTDMWEIFFETIAIEERINPRCQRNLFRIWMRKNAVEFQYNKYKGVGRF